MHSTGLQDTKGRLPLLHVWEQSTGSEETAIPSITSQ